jgi:undecaprenyl-diphosphatase
MIESFLNLLRHLRERLNLSLPQTVTLFLVLMFVASLVCMVLFGTIAEELLDNASMVAFDQQLAQALHNRASEGWTSAFALITLFGSQVVFILALIVAAYYAITHHWLHLGVWIAALAGGQLMNMLLKAIFARPRPSFADPLVVEQFYSFPSGHAMLSMIAYGLLAYFIIEVLNRRRYKTLVLTVATLLIVMIGLSRLYLGVHFFSDVVAGFLAGGAWLFACIAAMTYIRQRNVLRKNP